MERQTVFSLWRTEYTIPEEHIDISTTEFQNKIPYFACFTKLVKRYGETSFTRSQNKL